MTAMRNSECRECRTEWFILSLSCCASIVERAIEYDNHIRESEFPVYLLSGDCCSCMYNVV